ncbi:hypothetical protein ACS386_08050 [Flavobacteriaceae bacterium LMO-SS05]
MKKTRRDYIKIGLTIAIIAGLFMPYVSEILPFDVIWDWDSDWEFLFALPIPLLVVVPLLILFIFKHLLKDSILKVLKVVFLLVYLSALVDYGYGFYSDFDWSFTDLSLTFPVSILLSLILLLSSLKYSITKFDTLEHTILATMSLPIFLYFVYIFEDGIEDANYGFYIFNGSFIALYVISIYDIFKYRSVKQAKPA